MRSRMREEILDDITILMETNVTVLYRNRETPLENKVRDLINCITKTDYISPISIRYDDGIYTLRLGLNCKDASPISLGFQGSEDDFLKYLEKEFKKRKLQMVKYTKGVLINGDSNMFYPTIEL